MSKPKTRAWLIQCGPAHAPTPRYLMQSPDGQTSWTADDRHALRFAIKSDAERFGRNRVAGEISVHEV